MGLHDLINDREAESGTAFEGRLERFEYLFKLLRRHAGAGIAHGDDPLGTVTDEGNGETTDGPFSRGSAFHGADGVVAEIPKHLPESITLSDGEGFGRAEAALDDDALRTIAEQRERVFQQNAKIDGNHLQFLFARVGKEVGNDVVEPLGFTSDNIDERALIVGQCGDCRKNLDGACNRRKRIAYLVSNAGGKASDSGEAVAHSDFAFEAAKFSEIVEDVNVANGSAIRNEERSDGDAEIFISTG